MNSLNTPSTIVPTRDMTSGCAAQFNNYIEYEINTHSRIIGYQPMEIDENSDRKYSELL